MTGVIVVAEPGRASRAAPWQAMRRVRPCSSSTGSVRGADPASLRADLELVHGLLADRPGYVDGWIGRNLDDPDLWTLTTRWEHVGAYRRALSSYELKLQMPVLMRAIDEPSAYEVVEPNAVLNVATPRVT